MKLRQIALVAAELATVKQTLFQLLGLDDAYVDPGVGQFGLENIVMTIGTTFLEVVAPVQEGTTAGRLLQRRGDGGYMVIVQVDELATELARIEQTEIRTVFTVATPQAKAAHLHPRDVPGAIASLDEMAPAAAWYWAGPNWETRAARNVSAISAATIQSANPAATAARWSLAYGRAITTIAGVPTLEFDAGAVHFVADRDGRGDGLQAVDMRATDMTAILSAAKTLSLPVADNTVTVCGTRFNFFA